jgi:hypothetical protein
MEMPSASIIKIYTCADEMDEERYTKSGFMELWCSEVFVAPGKSVDSGRP